MTCRDEPPTAALEMISRLHARRSARHLALGRLDDDQRSGDGAGLQAVGAATTWLARVKRTADGVPFLVEEVLASPGVPASFRDTVRARLAGLDKAERLVLAAAAVQGRHFDWRLLAQATGERHETVLPGLATGN